jgi:hypothetical protein
LGLLYKNNGAYWQNRAVALSWAERATANLLACRWWKIDNDYQLLGMLS